MSVVIKKLDPSQREWANAKYREVDFLPSPASDLIAVAEITDAPAGLGRVTALSPSVGELGGMYVFPSYRGTGVSRLLIRFLMVEAQQNVLYCLPFEHLRELYESEGFELFHTNSDVPTKVQEKHAWCNTHYPDRVLLMRWQR